MPSQLLSSQLAPFTVYYENSEEYHRLKSEIFTQDCYYVELENERPVIIDAGAHIGLATLYFKKLFPTAHITAIEPNEQTAHILEQNIQENRLPDVTIVTKALATSAHAAMPFYRDQTAHRWWSTASFYPGAWTGDQQSELLQVATTTLRDVVTSTLAEAKTTTVDLLKMDIEGAEQAVLSAGQDQLPKIRHIFVEFHPVGGQQLPKLVEILEPHFSLTLTQDGREVDARKARGLVLVEGANRRLTR